MRASERFDFNQIGPQCAPNESALDQHVDLRIL